MLFSPIGQALLRKAFGAQQLGDVCVDRITLRESSRVERRQALFLEGDLDRVTGFAPTRTLALELARLKPGEMMLRACQACVLEDALVVDGNVFKGRAKQMVAGNTRVLIASISRLEPGGVLVANRQSHLYFGHWLTEELALTSQAKRLGPVVSTHFGRKPYAQESGYLGLYGLEAPLELPARCRVKQLTIVEGGGPNLAHVEGIAQLRQSLIDAGWHAANRRVFIRRGGGSPRRLVNESIIIDALSSRGFAIVDPETLSPEDVARACFGADIIVGVEGSHLAHGLIQLRPGTALVVIQPPDRFNNPFKDFCDAIGIDYGFVVAEAAGEGFSQSVESLERLLAQLA